MKKIVCLVASVLFLSEHLHLRRERWMPINILWEILMEPPVTWVMGGAFGAWVGMPLP